MQVNSGEPNEVNPLTNEFQQLLRDKAAELHEKIEAGELSEAVHVVQDLQEARDKSMYQEVGRLTRALHDAIRNFHIDANDSNSPEELSDMADATDRLDYVVQMTEKAANKTMDIVEDIIPISGGFKAEAEELKIQWQRMVERDISADEFRSLYWRIDRFFKTVEKDSGVVGANLSDILLAQDFQDLTGQVINRVTGLVREVEKSLLDLMLMASHVEAISGVVSDVTEEKEAKDPIEGEGPQMNADEKEDVVANQDDVDDLLSSLGF